jgi:hypothetical protein
VRDVADARYGVVGLRLKCGRAWIVRWRIDVAGDLRGIVCATIDLIQKVREAMTKRFVIGIGENLARMKPGAAGVVGSIIIWNERIVVWIFVGYRRFASLRDLR